VQYCRPSRPGTYIVGPGALRRWEIKMLPGETPADFEDEAAIRRVLASFVDVDALELCRSAIYRFHALVLDRWQHGRVFLAGDAAHQMPPFLGQGLCAGIRDALNLAWKIDGVERRGYAPSLLATYETERKPHAKTIVAHARAFGLVIGELDEAAARIRDAEMGAALAAGRSETVRQRFIPGLEAGLLARQADGTLQRGAGQLFVQPLVLTGDGTPQRLDDVTGPHFLIATDTPALLQALDQQTLAQWQALGGTQVLIGSPGAARPPGMPAATTITTACDALFADWLYSLDARAVVIRPDHYVYGAARSVAELRELLRSLAGALGGG
jgi:3-(3-hydroxy-phenyl)propionate hydroxylase